MKMKSPSLTMFPMDMKCLLKILDSIWKFVDSPVMMLIQKVVDMEIEWACKWLEIDFKDIWVRELYMFFSPGQFFSVSSMPTAHFSPIPIRCKTHKLCKNGGWLMCSTWSFASSDQPKQHCLLKTDSAIAFESWRSHEFLLKSCWLSSHY